MAIQLLTAKSKIPRSRMGIIIFVTPDFIKRYLQAQCLAPAYRRELRQVKGVVVTRENKNRIRGDERGKDNRGGGGAAVMY